MASLWEISIKSGLGKLRLQTDDLEQELLQYGVATVDIQYRHCLRVRDLPDIHRDPFDRMLIAQSEVERMELLTTDPVLAQYGPHIRVF